jgi:lipopolysaccharide/colanic/teichoic acid biosynthesis glycosyltransferase
VNTTPKRNRALSRLFPGSPVFPETTCRLNPSSKRGRVLKRSIDIVLAAALLALASPLLLLCALIVRLDSAGPAFFHQTRMGRNFRPFQMLKLRTMRFGGQGAAITLGLDARITRVGVWLRRWKFDELPQLWNVLRGEMSLVGPRPVIPELAREFVSDYEHLLKVRPGLTDPASVRYCREAEMLALAPDPLQYFKSVIIPEKLRISRRYLQNATVLSDLRVILQTAVVVLTPVQPLAPSPEFGRLQPQACPPPMSQD